ncbi:MAG TPA: hypothetical protein VFA53_00115 [Xanthobacteraceae bacterium]|nr:hypothetical protein [Xanthobacteraceae bacterium]
MSRDDLLRVLEVSAERLTVMLRDPTFPRPTISADGLPRWYSFEVEDWKANQIFQRKFSARC